MRKPVDALGTSLMLGLCLIWGMQQVAIKGIATDVAPVMQASLRCGLATGMVWVLSRVLVREDWLPGLTWRSGLVVAGLFAVEFLLVAEGLRWTSASHMSVFLFVAPVFIALGMHWLRPDERLRPGQWLGIGLAFAGVVVTFLGPDQGGLSAHLPYWWLGDLMGLGAALAWALTTVVIRQTRLAEAPVGQTLFYQLAGGSLVMFSYAVLSGQTAFHATPWVWASMTFQVLLVAFLSNVGWIWLLRRYLSVQLGVLSLMTPVFGVAMGALILQEPLDRAFLLGSLLVLAGVLGVNGRGLRQVLVRWLQRDARP